MEYMVMPSEDCVSHGIVELKRIPNCISIALGCRIFGRNLPIFCLEHHKKKAANTAASIQIFPNLCSQTKSCQLFSFEDWSSGDTIRGYTGCVHVPSLVLPKDIIRNYICKHPMKPGVSDIKIQAWTTSVTGWSENDESELLEIPRGQPRSCLPLPEDLKFLSKFNHSNNATRYDQRSECSSAF